MNYNEVILDMLNRIIILEREVALLKDAKFSSEQDLGGVLRYNMQCDPCERRSHSYKEMFTADSTMQRDKTRYMFNGNVYLKNRLVLAVVKDYVSKNKTITCDELKAVFDKSLQGSIGVVEYESVAKRRKDCKVRFFEKEDDILRLSDGNMLVCSQWGILNISNFITRAEQLGYKIDSIVRE